MVYSLDTKTWYGDKMTRTEIDRKIVKDGKNMDFLEAVYAAFPDAKPDEEFGVTACGMNLLVRRFARDAD